MGRERLMTAGEVADYLSCSVSTVRRLAAAGRVPHYRLGRIVRFRRAEVDAWLVSHQEGDVPLIRTAPASDTDQLNLFDAGAAGTASPGG